jgi:hypothetical protein
MRGVLSGYSAAELLDASCGPFDAPAEVTVPGGPQRAHPGLLVHRDRLAPGEIVELHRVGIAFDGEEHLTPAGVRGDIARTTDLVDRGWRLYRCTADAVHGEPERIVAQVGRALGLPRWR